MNRVLGISSCGTSNDGLQRWLDRFVPDVLFEIHPTIVTIIACRTASSDQPRPDERTVSDMFFLFHPRNYYKLSFDNLSNVILKS